MAFLCRRPGASSTNAELASTEVSFIHASEHFPSHRVHLAYHPTPINHLTRDFVCLQLSGDDFYGLSAAVRTSLFETFGIKQLHKWQSEMLDSYFADECVKKNALILAPTSGGKSLVAIIILLRTLLLEERDAILVLPFVAIVAEKVFELKQLATSLSKISVAEYAGSKGRFPVPKRKLNLRTLYVSTPEKAAGISKFLCEEGQRSDEIGLVCLDEFHMMGDGSSGSVVEELVVSLHYRLSSSARILALSATVGNPDDVSTFLGGGISTQCNTYTVSRRPTKIAEHVVVSGVAIPIVRRDGGAGYIDFSNKGPNIVDEDRDRELLECSALKNLDDQVIAKLVLQSISQGESVLIFCNTRRLCVRTCEMLTEAHRLLGM